MAWGKGHEEDLTEMQWRIHEKAIRKLFAILWPDVKPHQQAQYCINVDARYCLIHWSDVRILVRLDFPVLPFSKQSGIRKITKDPNQLFAGWIKPSMIAKILSYPWSWCAVRKGIELHVCEFLYKVYAVVEYMRCCTSGIRQKPWSGYGVFSLLFPLSIWLRPKGSRFQIGHLKEHRFCAMSAVRITFRSKSWW